MDHYDSGIFFSIFLTDSSRAVRRTVIYQNDFQISKRLVKHVAYVDADDWIEPTMYEDMYIKMTEEKVDIVMCGRYSNQIYLYIFLDFCLLSDIKCEIAPAPMLII